MSLNCKKKIYLLSTGGTIEKSYDESDGILDNRKSIIQRMLALKLRLPYLDVEIRSILAKDSLLMDKEDRQSVSAVVRKLQMQQRPMVILHGTDTMELTASFCYQQIKNPSAAVVFTGAMRPMEFGDSDALQNVTEALMVAQVLSPGFYISFHSRIFSLPNVRKNNKILTFEQF